MNKEVTKEFEIAEGILSLIGKKLPKAVFARWTPKQRKDAIDYAGACHIRASDNHNRVPSCPKVVNDLKDFKMKGIWNE